MQRVWSTYLESRSPTPNIETASISRSSIDSSTHPLAPLRVATPQTPVTPLTPTSSTTYLISKRPDAVNNSSVSLAVNYVPSKFAPGQLTKRIPRQRARIEALTIDDGQVKDVKYPARRKKRWTKSKWALFFANSLLTAYSLASLLALILVYLNTLPQSRVLVTGNRTALALSFVFSILSTLTALLGWSGILLNNRPFLAVYTFLLWICFAFLLAPGYITYKTRTFNLEGKINAQWSRDLGVDGRRIIQTALGCCGYFSPFVEATVTQTCYSRSVLPGCKGPYIDVQRMILKKWFTLAFSLVPAHLFIMTTALLCSNHVTNRFGKGMTPVKYRLKGRATLVSNTELNIIGQSQGIGRDR